MTTGKTKTSIVNSFRMRLEAGKMAGFLNEPWTKIKSFKSAINLACCL